MVLICLFLASEGDYMVLLTLLELDGVGLGMGCRLGSANIQSMVKLTGLHLRYS